MATGDAVKRRVLKRITDSGLTLTVHYAPARVPATGAAPGSAMTNPLTGPKETLKAIPDATTPAKPSVTVACLWIDGLGTGVTGTLPDSRHAIEAAGWMAGADAAARVRVDEAAEDPDDPYGDTIFTDAEVVEFQSRRYRVMSVQPVAAGFLTPYTYYVWLRGAAKQ